MISDYLKANRLDKNNSADDKIAVVYAEGSITEAKSEEETNISGKEYVNIFDKIEKDKKIKAVVLRINSPGGSAVASEQILQAINDLKKIKKIPVIVSMGDVAASGGYYIACQADKIYAEPNTITGSIGVFGMIPDVSKLMETKLGIHFDTVKTAPLAEGVTGVFPMSKPTLDYFQRDVDRVYDVFLSRVAKGRNKSKEEIHTIAQGRIWTGNMAKNNGLVDEIGSLEDAVLYASTKANIKNYKITEYPKIKDPINRLIDKYVNKKENETKANIKALSGDAYFIFDALTQIQQWNGVQARLPFMLNKF
jgi:protease-4